MASSPWKFLFGLGRRRDQGDDRATASSEPERTRLSDEDEPVAASAPATPSEQTVDGRAELEAEKFATPSEAPPESDVTVAAQQVTAQELTSPANANIPKAAAPSSSKIRPKKARIPRVKSKASTSQAALAAAPEPAPVTSSPAAQAIQELDDEIRELRHQLVQRLRVQNAHLKRMLDRFERN